MKRILIVANRTVAGYHLHPVVRELLEQDECRFHVVVPAIRGAAPANRVGDDSAMARVRLDVALEQFRSLGAQVTGELGDISPLQAVTDAMAGTWYDEIIVSTPPPAESHWMRSDLIFRLHARFPTARVRHVVAVRKPLVDSDAVIDLTDSADERVVDLTDTADILANLLAQAETASTFD